MILMAVIVAAHGIRGAVKVKCFTEDPVSIMAYGPLHDEQGHVYQLSLLRVSASDHLIAQIVGIGDRNQAEALKGTRLYIERNQLPDLVDEEFYYSDLLGLMVQDLQGEVIGQVCAVNNYGAGDFLEIKDSKHHLYTISFTREAVPVIQLPEKGREGVLKIERKYLLDSTVSRQQRDPGEQANKKKE